MPLLQYKHEIKRLREACLHRKTLLISLLSIGNFALTSTSLLFKIWFKNEILLHNVMCGDKILDSDPTLRISSLMPKYNNLYFSHVLGFLHMKGTLTFSPGKWQHCFSRLMRTAVFCLRNCIRLSYSE